MSTYIDPNTETWIEQLQARIAELEAMHDHQHLLDLADEAVAAKKRIAELEQELKNQVELHNEWLGTYRIKLDYIKELERKIKRLTT